MEGLLIVNSFLNNKKFSELTDLFVRAADQLSIELSVQTNADVPVVLRQPENAGKVPGQPEDAGKVPGQPENAGQVPQGESGAAPYPGFGRAGGTPPDFVLFWDKDTLLAERLEDRNIRVFNSSRCIALCDDKRKMHLALSRAGIPAPDTVFAPFTYSGIGFTNYDFLVQAENMLGYPMIVKEAYGSFGEQVHLAGERSELLHIVRTCGTTELLFQKYIVESRGRDARIQVVGGKVAGSIYRFSEHDFRANISAGGHMEPYHPSETEKKLALEAAEAVGADFAGVDILFGADGPLVCEVNSNAHFKNLMDCTGTDTALEIVDYIRNCLE